MAGAISRGVIYAVMIEGFGDATAIYTSDQRYRWTWGRSLLDYPAAHDPDELYKDGLLRWPREVGASVDFLFGQVSTGTQTIELLGDDFTWPQLARTIVPVSGTLTAAVDAVVPSVDLSVTGLPVGTVIYIEREAMGIGVEAPAFTYAVDRGILGTQAQSHGVDPDDDVEVFETMYPSTLAGRRVDLLTIDIEAPLTIAPYSKETIIWSGVLRGITLPTPHTIQIDVDDVLSLVRGRRLMRDQWRGVFQQVGAFVSPTLDPLPAARESDGDLRAPLILRVNEDGVGRTVWRVSGNTILAGSEDPGTWTAVQGYPIPLPSIEDMIAGIGSMPAWELITNWIEQPPSGIPPPSTNTLPLSQDPAILVLQLLLTTADGENSATYDIGRVPVAGSIPEIFVDVAGIEDWGRTRARGRNLDNLILGIEGEPEELWDVIQDRILHMLGAVLLPGRGGLLTVAQFSDSPEYLVPPVVIDADVILGEPSYSLPAMDRRLPTSIDSVDVAYGLRADGKSTETITARDHLNRRRKGLGEASGFEIDAGATTDRGRAISVASGTVATWHNPIPLITVEVLRTVDLWPGEICSLSHPLLMGIDGTRGMVGGRCLCVGRTDSLQVSGHSIRLELLFVGAAYTTDPCWIAPSGQVAVGGWDPVTSEITLVADAFSTADDRIHPDAAGFFALDVIQVCDPTGAVRVGHDAIAVVSVAGNVIEVDPATLPAVPAITDDDIIRVSTYTSAVTSQRSTWAFKADGAGELGADDAKEYTNP